MRRGKMSVVDTDYGLCILLLAHLQPALFQVIKFEAAPGVGRRPLRPPAIDLSIGACRRGMY
jgi:hypothetical protein